MAVHANFLTWQTLLILQGILLFYEVSNIYSLHRTKTDKSIQQQCIHASANWNTQKSVCMFHA